MLKTLSAFFLSLNVLEQSSECVSSYLPDEQLHLIFGALHPFDFHRAAAVSSQFQLIAQKSIASFNQARLKRIQNFKELGFQSIK